MVIGIVVAVVVIIALFAVSVYNRADQGGELLRGSIFNDGCISEEKI